MKLRVAADTDIGKWRTNNEDAYYTDAKIGLFIVADGMGGHQAGEVASHLAVDEIRGFVERLDSPAALEELKKAVEDANSCVYLRSESDHALHSMGTTVVAASIRDNRLFLAHIGDSRAYILAKTGLQRLTDDHSVVFELVKNGKISEQEARKHPSRGVLLQALGINPKAEVDCQEFAYNGEPLLLCTDGLTDMLEDHEIEDLLRSESDPQLVCERIVESANAAGGKDNITVVIVRGA